MDSPRRMDKKEKFNVIDACLDLCIAIDRLNDNIEDLCMLLREQREWQYSLSHNHNNLIASVLE